MNGSNDSDDSGMQNPEANEEMNVNYHPSPDVQETDGENESDMSGEPLMNGHGHSNGVLQNGVMNGGHMNGQSHMNGHLSNGIMNGGHLPGESFRTETQSNGVMNGSHRSQQPVIEHQSNGLVHEHDLPGETQKDEYQSGQTTSTMKDKIEVVISSPEQKTMDTSSTSSSSLSVEAEMTPGETYHPTTPDSGHCGPQGSSLEPSLFFEALLKKEESQRMDADRCMKEILDFIETEVVNAYHEGETEETEEQTEEAVFHCSPRRTQIRIEADSDDGNSQREDIKIEENESDMVATKSAPEEDKPDSKSSTMAYTILVDKLVSKSRVPLGILASRLLCVLHERIRRLTREIVSNHEMRPVIPLALSPLVDLGAFNMIFRRCNEPAYFYRCPDNEDFGLTEEEFERQIEKQLRPIGKADHIPPVGRMITPPDHSQRFFEQQTEGPRNFGIGTRMKNDPKSDNPAPTLLMDNPITLAYLGGSPYTPEVHRKLGFRMFMDYKKAMAALRKFILEEAYLLVQQFKPKLAEEWIRKDRQLMYSKPSENFLEEIQSRIRILGDAYDVILSQRPTLAHLWNIFDANEEYLSVTAPAFEYKETQIPSSPVCYIVNTMMHHQGGLNNPIPDDGSTTTSETQTSPPETEGSGSQVPPTDENTSHQQQDQKPETDSDAPPTNEDSPGQQEAANDKDPASQEKQAETKKDVPPTEESSTCQQGAKSKTDDKESKTQQKDETRKEEKDTGTDSPTNEDSEKVPETVEDSVVQQQAETNADDPPTGESSATQQKLYQEESSPPTNGSPERQQDAPVDLDLFNNAVAVSPTSFERSSTGFVPKARGHRAIQRTLEQIYAEAGTPITALGQYYQQSLPRQPRPATPANRPTLTTMQVRHPIIISHLNAPSPSQMVAGPSGLRATTSSRTVGTVQNERVQSKVSSENQRPTPECNRDCCPKEHVQSRAASDDQRPTPVCIRGCCPKERAQKRPSLSEDQSPCKRVSANNAPTRAEHMDRPNGHPREPSVDMDMMNQQAQAMDQDISHASTGYSSMDALTDTMSTELSAMDAQTDDDRQGSLENLVDEVMDEQNLEPCEPMEHEREESQEPMEQGREKGQESCEPMEQEREPSQESSAPMEQETEQRQEACELMDQDRAPSQEPVEPMEQEREQSQEPMEQERETTPPSGGRLPPTSGMQQD